MPFMVATVEVAKSQSHVALLSIAPGQPRYESLFARGLWFFSGLIPKVAIPTFAAMKKYNGGIALVVPFRFIEITGKGEV